MKPIQLPQKKTTKDKILEIAETLKPGQGIPVSEVATEVGLDPNNVRKHAKALGCYVVINNNAYVTSRA